MANGQRSGDVYLGRLRALAQALANVRAGNRDALAVVAREMSRFGHGTFAENLAWWQDHIKAAPPTGE